MVAEDVTGRLVEPTEAELSAAMVLTARDREGAAEMGRQAREKALAEFSLDVQAERVEELYRTVAGARSQGDRPQGA
jgi:glycosyltransferase involved in cell wall biosynthesis